MKNAILVGVLLTVLLANCDRAPVVPQTSFAPNLIEYPNDEIRLYPYAGLPVSFSDSIVVAERDIIINKNILADPTIDKVTIQIPTPSIESKVYSKTTIYRTKQLFDGDGYYWEGQAPPQEYEEILHDIRISFYFDKKSPTNDVANSWMPCGYDCRTNYNFTRRTQVLQIRRFP